MIDFKAARTEYQAKVAKLIENRGWVAANLSELQRQYEGKWIGIVNSKVVAQGDALEEVEKKSGISSPLDILIMSVPVGEISRPI